MNSQSRYAVRSDLRFGALATEGSLGQDAIVGSATTRKKAGTSLAWLPGLFSRKWGVLTPLVRPRQGLPSQPRASGAFLWVHTTRS